MRLLSSFLLSAISSLVQYSLKVTVTNSDNFNTINKSGKDGGGGGGLERGRRAKKITRGELFYRHLTGYVQDRVRPGWHGARQGSGGGTWGARGACGDLPEHRLVGVNPLLLWRCCPAVMLDSTTL